MKIRSYHPRAGKGAGQRLSRSGLWICRSEGGTEWTEWIGLAAGRLQWLSTRQAGQKVGQSLWGLPGRSVRAGKSSEASLMAAKVVAKVDIAAEVGSWKQMSDLLSLRLSFLLRLSEEDCIEVVELGKRVDRRLECSLCLKRPLECLG